ncbi:MAG TPA: hypothetical protein VLE22_09705 [Bryobacteraceae bacterium]|jgi:hypothetical protein|nr:hypothetical protein [Bryobacteraceae bacterium]
MKRILLLLLSLALFAFGAEEKKKAPRPKPGQKAQEIALPAGAQEIAPYTYRYKDDQGKTWIYRRTPFGLAKFEEKLDDKADEIAPENMRAFEEGDSIRFERPTPFGTARWVRKKSELNDVEKAAWERELKRSVKTADRKQEQSQAKSQQ